jgi:hypothetical protein
MKPLLIVDCDGVLLHFIAPFRQYLQQAHGLELRMDDAMLSSNIRRDGVAVPWEEFRALLAGFFADGQQHQTILQGVADALAVLGATAEIVVLTNIDAAHRPARLRVLAREGLPYPVIANGDGVPKGRAVAALAAGRCAVFVDDLPHQHASVAKHAPHVGRLHLVAEPGVAGLLPAAPDAHARIDDWATARPWIETWFTTNPVS